MLPGRRLQLRSGIRNVFNEVPVIGSLINSGENFLDGNWKAGVGNLVMAGVDYLTLGSGTVFKKGVKEGVEVLSKEAIETTAAKTSTNVFQKHHIIPNQVYKGFKTDLKAMGWKQNNMFNLKKLPTPFHGNHPAYNNYIMNEMNLLKQSGNLNLNSMQKLQQKMRLMTGDAYRSGKTLNQYFKF